MDRGNRPDQAILERIDMPDDVVLHDIAGEVPNNLVDLHGHASVTRGTEAHGLDGRIDHAPLPSPVVADAAVPEHGAALHAIGPGDIRVHRGQNGLDVPRIEGGIGFPEQALEVVHETATITLFPSNVKFDRPL
jgi:hypothetical protein